VKVLIRTYSTELKEKIGKKVLLYGWVELIRDLGKLCFLICRDGQGEFQVVLKNPKKEWKEIPRESAIKIIGTVQESKDKKFGVEVLAENIEIISKAIETPPIDFKTEPNFDTRFEWRILDLRREKVRKIFRVAHIFTRAFHEYLTENKFVEVHTPKIIAAGAEGGANLFPIVYFEKEAFLAQSPQLYKQMLIPVFERVYEVAPIFRAEKHNTTRHLNECISMDIEIGFIEDEFDVLKVFEGYIKYAVELLEDSKLVEDLPSPKIKVIEFLKAKELLRDLGVENPELDFNPEEERKLGEYFEEEGYDFIAVSKFPWEPRAFYYMKGEKQDGIQLTRTFDVIYRGLELWSGGQREHRYDKLIEQIKEKGLKPENYEFYLNAFKFGMPPHGGFGMGLERLVMKTLRLSNIREASLFPRDRTRLVP
jgi:aspartyl-tRNA synthetase